MDIQSVSSPAGLEFVTHARPGIEDLDGILPIREAT